MNSQSCNLFLNEGPKFSIQQMFNIVNRTEQSFGIPNYDYTREYLDPIKIVQDREYAKKTKSDKPKQKPTKKGSFLDPILNIDRKKYPAPVHYDTVIKWPESKPTNPKKFVYPKRLTYVDEINNDRYKTPGVGNYKLLPSQADLKAKQAVLNTKKVKYGEQFPLFCNTENLSVSCPGAGQYNPHKIEKKLKIQPENDTPKNNIANDKEKEQKKIIEKKPSVGAYTPLANTFQTFDIIEKDAKKIKPIKYLGTEERFKKPSKKVFRLNVPGPGNYNVNINWKGKDGSLPPTQRKKQPSDWYTKISQGFSSTRSIYY